jgi:hypothetical protein
MDKKFLCLMNTDGYRMRVRVDTIMEYGDLYEGDAEDNPPPAGEEKKIIGAYINESHTPGEATHCMETVEQLDEMLSGTGYVFVDVGYCGEGHDAEEDHSDFDIYRRDALLQAQERKEREEYSKKAAGGIVMPPNQEPSEPFKKAWEKYEASQPKDPTKWQKAFDTDAKLNEAQSKLDLIMPLLKEVAVTDDAIRKFLLEPRECWSGRTPIQMLASDNVESVLRYLRRIKDGDPVS